MHVCSYSTRPDIDESLTGAGTEQRVIWTWNGWKPIYFRESRKCHSLTFTFHSALDSMLTGNTERNIRFSTQKIWAWLRRIHLALEISCLLHTAMVNNLLITVINDTLQCFYEKSEIQQGCFLGLEFINKPELKMATIPPLRAVTRRI